MRTLRTREALRLRILELCAQDDLSLNGFCTRCGVRQSTVNNIIRRRNNSLTVETLYRICKGSGITLYDFFNSDLFRNIEQEIY